MNEFVDKIPSVNARHLLESQLYHVYADSHGSVNEVLIQRVGGSVYGIIAEFFHDGSSRGGSSSASSTILTPDGYLFSPENPDQRLSVEFEMYRRLLNPMNWSGWQYQKRYAQRRIPDDYFRRTYPKTVGPISVHAFVDQKIALIQSRG